MAAIAAAVIGAAGAGLSAYGQSQAGKGAKTKSDRTPTFTPQGQMIQDQMIKLLFSRMGKAPQRFGGPGGFLQTGPQAAMDLNQLPFHIRQGLGLPTGLPQMVPPGVNPDLMSVLQHMGVTPPGPTFQPGGPGAPQLAPAPPMNPGGPMSGPRR